MSLPKRALVPFDKLRAPLTTDAARATRNAQLTGRPAHPGVGGFVVLGRSRLQPHSGFSLVSLVVSFA